MAKNQTAQVSASESSVDVVLPASDPPAQKKTRTVTKTIFDHARVFAKQRKALADRIAKRRQDVTDAEAELAKLETETPDNVKAIGKAGEEAK